MLTLLLMPQTGIIIDLPVLQDDPLDLIRLLLLVLLMELFLQETELGVTGGGTSRGGTREGRSRRGRASSLGPRSLAVVTASTVQIGGVPPETKGRRKNGLELKRQHT